MRCQQCDVDIEERLASCPLCSAALVDMGSAHIVGRVRGPTPEETMRAPNLYRADAVLGLTGAAPDDLGALELLTARLIDGTRPVARLQKKSGMSSVELRNALTALHARRLIRLVGIVEPAGVAAAGDDDHDATRRISEAEMMISARAMAEIAAMIEEDKALSLDDDTESSIETATDGEEAADD